jgi:DNA-binding beta-propeller fold protein YncE
MLNPFRRLISCHVFAALALTGCFAAITAHAQKPFHIKQRWNIGGSGSWDYTLIDARTHHLYIAHQTQVDVIDARTGKVIGAIQGLTRCHGIVIAPDGKTGFISDGGAGNVVVFDPSNLATITKIPAGINPDGMVYERSTNTLWAFNGGSRNVTVIDAAERKPIATIALPGKPEFPVTDDHGTIFDNIEDKGYIVRLDAKTYRVTAIWTLAGCDSPSGLAFDRAGGRLFSVCDGNKMAVTDSHTGRSLARPSIGQGPDAAAYDPRTKLAFSSNGDGTLTVVNAGEPGYPIVQTLATMKGARTMTLDAQTETIYLVSAKLGATPPATEEVPHPRPSIVPGTFTVLVAGRD